MQQILSSQSAIVVVVVVMRSSSVAELYLADADHRVTLPRGEEIESFETVLIPAPTSFLEDDDGLSLVHDHITLDGAVGS